MRMYISLTPTHGSTLPKQKLETRVHATFNAALAMPATLAALGAIFKAFSAQCPREPRLPRGEMQAVPCGARSNTRLLPASSTSQPLPAGIGSVRKYNTGIGRRAPKPPTHPIHMCTAATTAACCCCYCCCCCAATEVNLVQVVTATAAVLLLRLVEQRAIFYEQNNEEQRKQKFRKN